MAKTTSLAVPKKTYLNHQVLYKNACITAKSLDYSDFFGFGREKQSDPVFQKINRNNLQKFLQQNFQHPSTTEFFYPGSRLLPLRKHFKYFTPDIILLSAILSLKHIHITISRTTTCPLQPHWSKTAMLHCLQS